MAKRQKTKAFSFQGFESEHYKTTDAYARAVGNLFDRATNDIAAGVANLNVDPNKPFQFSDYPSVQATMKRIANKLAKGITAVISEGSRKQWLFACQKNDAFVESIMDTSKLTKAKLSKYQDRNLDALKSFQERKVDGMNLSQRVWKYTDQFRAQIEAGLDVGLGEGRSAQELSRDLRQNLVEPNRLFRRVRDKYGNLQLSKAAQAYHPGQGVYRSSYKNAMRLTRSETNMAYREADWLRWQQLDFVVGFEIHRSNHEPMCKCSLCARLVGRYPKWFKFKGFHPQCMCYATPILSDDETFNDQELSDLKSALHGTEYKKLVAKNQVNDVPDAFKEWIEENVDAQKNWGSTPYFVKDNFVDGKLSKGLKPHVEEEPVAVPKQKKWSELDEEKKKEAKKRLFSVNLDGDLVDACDNYGISYQYARELSNTILDDFENNWFKVDEFHAEVARLEAECDKKRNAFKSQAHDIFDRYVNAISETDNLTWGDGTRKNVISFVSGKLKDEDSKRWGEYVSFLNSSSIGDSGIQKERNEIQKTKDAYNNAVTAAKAKIAEVNDASKTKALSALLNETPSPGRTGKTLTDEIMKEINALVSLLGQRTPEQRANETDFCKEYGITQGNDMTFDEANKNRGNPNYEPHYVHDDNGKYYDRNTGEHFSENPKYKKRYTINCQSCVVANELRRRGMDVAARGNTKGSMPERVSYCTEMVWVDKNGNMPKKTQCSGIDASGVMKIDTMLARFNDATKDVGRYHINWAWNSKNSGHIITCERLSDGTLRIYDPQNGELITDFAKYASRFRLSSGIYVLRVDTLKINIQVAKEVLEKQRKKK